MTHEPSLSRRSVVLAAALAPAAWAQPERFPQRPIRMVVPGGAGGGADTVARLLAGKMAAHLGQPVVVDNVPGAGGIVGAGKALGAPPDGYTVLFAISNLVTTSQHLFAKLPYDVEQIRPVGLVAKGSYLLLASPALPASGVADLIDLARRKPGQLAYASVGAGGTQHLGMEMLKQEAGIDLLHVPYRESGAAHSALMAGEQVQLMLDPVSSAAGLVRGGKLKALAATGANRVRGLPDVPVIAETLKGFDLRGWNSLWVPASVPDAAISVLNRALRASVEDAELARRLEDMGMEPQASSPAELAALRKAESLAWGRLIASRRIRTE